MIDGNLSRDTHKEFAMTTPLTLAQACALPHADAVTYVSNRVAQGFKNEAKGATWTRALEALRANAKPDTTPPIVGVIARAKAAKAAKPAPAPKAVITPITPIANAPKAVAFTRTHETVAEPKGAIANLHNRLCVMEAAVVRLADAQDKTAALLVRLTSGK